MKKQVLWPLRDMLFASIDIGFVLLSGHGPVGSTASLNGTGNNVQAI
jgi:hypothetical protein